MSERFAAFTVVVLAASLLQAPFAYGDEPAADAETILEVSVRGNQRMSDDSILGNIRTRPGAPFSEDVAKDDQRRLMQTGRFDNVVVIKAPTADGLLVTFVVTERKLINAVILRGAKSISEKKLRKQFSLGADDPLDFGRASLARMSIEDFYRSKGYYFASVTLDEERLKTHQQVVFEIVEGPKVRVRSLDFQFEDTKSFPKRKLRQQMKTKKAIWIITRGKLDPDQLAQDVFSLRSFYRDEGYLDVEISRELTFTPDKSRADVLFTVDEGPRYRIGEVRFEGNEIFADPELISRLSMQPGRYFSMLELRRDTKAVKDAYGQIGYVDVAATPRSLFTAPSTPVPEGLEIDEENPALLILSYKITEGDPFRVGRITIRGNDVTKERVVRRQMTMFPGQLFNTVAMAKSEQTLNESRLFGRASIEPYGGDDEFRNVLVDVEEGKTAELTFGAGYSTNSGVLGTFSFTQRNFSWTERPSAFRDLFKGRGFKGDGQTLRLHLEPGVEVFRAKLDWREPYLFDRPLSLGVGAYVFNRERESYDEGSTGAHVSLGKLFKNRWYGELATRVEGVKIDQFEEDVPSEVLADAGDHFTVNFQGILVRDRTDSRWQPSKGGRVNLTTQQFVGDYTFTQYGAAYTHYWTTHIDALDRKHILAARTSGDYISGSAPVYRRFYGGGIGSVRGFEYRGISPRTQDPGLTDPIGGDFMAYLGAEYSFPLVARNLRGVFFLDTGTVESEWTVTTWRASIGAGIRLIIPMMGPVPMSLDFGIPIVEDMTDENQLVNFSVGWTF